MINSTELGQIEKVLRIELQKAGYSDIESDNIIEKAKYIRREGTAGNYKYIYDVDTPKTGQSQWAVHVKDKQGDRKQEEKQPESPKKEGAKKEYEGLNSRKDEINGKLKIVNLSDKRIGNRGFGDNNFALHVEGLGILKFKDNKVPYLLNNKKTAKEIIEGGGFSNYDNIEFVPMDQVESFSPKVSDAK